jgi:DNA-binding transcriptional MerR regulator
MISIGDFARIGRVSVRMLRHYDAIGLLSPEHVDPYTGYRYYRIEQLRRLNRIVALKELGLRLQARLRLIEVEQTVSYPEVTTTKTVPAMTVVGLKAIADSATQEAVGPVIGPMYPQIIELLGKAGVTPIGPSVAYYTPAPNESEDAVWVHATFPVPVESVPGLDTVEIPAGHRGVGDPPRPRWKGSTPRIRRCTAGFGRTT